MKLYDVPPNSTIRIDEHWILDFHHVDGMYSYCTDKDGNVVHLAAWTEVEVIKEGTCHPAQQ